MKRFIFSVPAIAIVLSLSACGVSVEELETAQASA